MDHRQKLHRQSVPVLGLAVLLLSSCQALEERRAEVSRDRALVLYDRGYYDAAAEELTKHVEDFPDDARAWTTLGHAHQGLDETADALRSYDRALELDPRSFEAALGKGILFRKRGELDQAAAVYQSILEIEPGYAEAYSNLSIVAIQQDRFDDAVSLGEKARQLDAEDPVIAANLALAYHYAGDVERRDALAATAEELGYDSVDQLRSIFAGYRDIRQ